MNNWKSEQFVFFFSDTATTEIYTLPLHDALPISERMARWCARRSPPARSSRRRRRSTTDRKSTRLNSSHGYTPYAVFCLKNKLLNEHRALPFSFADRVFRARDPPLRI